MSSQNTHIKGVYIYITDNINPHLYTLVQEHLLGIPIPQKNSKGAFNVSLSFKQFIKNPQVISRNTPPKFNSSPLKSSLPKGKVDVEPSFFRGYVKLQVGMRSFEMTD